LGIVGDVEAKMGWRKPWSIALIVAAGIIAEFFVLEGTIGISFPADRRRAVSTIEIREQRDDVHFVTTNRRFSAVDRLTASGTSRQLVILRETLFMDRVQDREGPSTSSVTVEALDGNRVRWRFQAPGERAYIVTDNLYVVFKPSNGETANTYTYFSLADGQKLRVSRNVELSTEELEKLNGSIVK
jgi:hypothetical protein